MATTRKEARMADQAAVEAAKPVGGEVDSVEAPGGSGRGDQGGVLLHHDCQALRRGDLHQVTISPPPSAGSAGVGTSTASPLPGPSPPTRSSPS